MELRKTLDSLVQRDDFKYSDITVHLENGQVISVGDFFDPNIKVKRSLDFFKKHPEYKLDKSSYIVINSYETYYVLSDAVVAYFTIRYNPDVLPF
ncbi:hypothetical protein LBSP_21520 [Lentilactobacillus buchneri subsp. silagei]|uniref:hypothetical protein n=1 Tax=Lentilactobacillus buchneri TaxID=1581 RepID=UPI0012E63A33|nr:hypothetical protein [Lentilactobacillus buchneri]GED95592.1 hypothetical protein LBSP_21520 [Lentilactobacillus buchneri subsp. silagei]